MSFQLPFCSTRCLEHLNKTKNEKKKKTDKSQFENTTREKSSAIKIAIDHKTRLSFFSVYSLITTALLI